MSREAAVFVFSGPLSSSESMGERAVSLSIDAYASTHASTHAFAHASACASCLDTAFAFAHDDGVFKEMDIDNLHIDKLNNAGISYD